MTILIVLVFKYEYSNFQHKTICDCIEKYKYTILDILFVSIFKYSNFQHKIYILVLKNIHIPF